MGIREKIEETVKKTASHFGIYFSRQPAKYDLLKEEIRMNLLKKSESVLHIGAHYGQEAKVYNDLDLNVIWIEAASGPFKILSQNIKKYQKQVAIKALLGDKKNKKIKFYQSNNDTSSSLFEFGQDMLKPGLKMIGAEELIMVRLEDLFNTKKLKNYQYWCIDVQGAELLVLKGAGKLLSLPKVIEIEVSTREEYKGGASYSDVLEYLVKYGFIPIWYPKTESHENIIFTRIYS